MFSFSKSIDKAVENKRKIAQLTNEKFPNNGAEFHVGIDPENGGYTIVAYLKKDKSLALFLPSSIGGFRIIVDGMTGFNIPNDMEI